MKKELYLLCISLSIINYLNAQTASNFTITTTSPSCPTCCDGVATVTSLNPSCHVLGVMWSNNATTQSINNCCYGMTYTASINGGACGTEIEFCTFNTPATT